MVRHGLTALCMALGLARQLGPANAAPATPEPPPSATGSDPADWPTLAVGDLHAIHDLIRDNHPGPVDADNPQFGTWLERGMAEALPLAEAAHSRSAYEYALRAYANGFADGHLDVRFPPRDAALWPGFLTTADSFDWTVDWRVSERNAAALQSDAAMLRAAGQAEPADHLSALAARMAALSRTGTKLLSVPEPAGPAPAPFPSPFRHPVYVLTDPNCASACLDFMDLLHRLPGVVQVGLPTSADTPYLELASAPLPSGQATLAYAMKVHRNRARRNNEWYDPAIPWPGGAMTDEAVAAWIASLP